MSLSSITLIAVREIDSNLQGNWGMNINDCSVDEGSGKPSEVGSLLVEKGRGVEGGTWGEEHRVGPRYVDVGKR